MKSLYFTTENHKILRYLQPCYKQHSEVIRKIHHRPSISASEENSVEEGYEDITNARRAENSYKCIFVWCWQQK